MKEPFDDIEVLAKEAGLSEVSPKFLMHVMNGVRAERTKVKDIQPYKPLLSGKAWFMVGFMCALIVLFALITQGSTNETTISSLSITMINKIKFSVSLPNFVPYKTTVYSICFLILCFFVQVPVLKRRFDKQFTV